MEACCTRFTAAEGGARLAASASIKNTLVTEYASFIATRLVHEEAYKIRGCLYDGKQRSVYVTRASRIQCIAYELRILTDLSILEGAKYEDVYDWCAELDKKEVLVCTSAVLKRILEEGLLVMSNINVLILDSCHLICKDTNLQYIMKMYKECDVDKMPRILALTYPLFASNRNKDRKTDNDEQVAVSDENVDDKENDNVDVCETNMDTANSVREDDTSNKLSEELKGSKEEGHSNIVECSRRDDESLKEENAVKKSEDNELVRETRVDTDKEIILNNEQQCAKVDEDLREKEISDVTRKQEMEIGVYENLDDFKMYETLEWKIENLEDALCCQMDLAEDIDGGKRIISSVTKPKEVIIEHGSPPKLEELPPLYIELEKFMRDTINDTMVFIDDHRYDPTEIYGDELYEEFKNIPDPTIEPRSIFRQFLYVLEQLGPYAADKAAFSLLIKLEKLKIKVPYERHFLLLCLCTTVFIKIRCYADMVFNKYESDWEKIRVFSTPKVLRFAEILEKFQPPDSGKSFAATQTDTCVRVDSIVDGVAVTRTKKDGNLKIDCDNTASGHLAKKGSNVIDNIELKTDQILVVDNEGKAVSSHARNNNHRVSDVTLINEIENIPEVKRDEDVGSKTPVVDFSVNIGDNQNLKFAEDNSQIKDSINNEEFDTSKTVVNNDSVLGDNELISVNRSRDFLKDNEESKENTDNSNISNSKELKANNPDGSKRQNRNHKNSKKLTARLIKDIDECNFTALGDRIEDRVNIYQANLRDIDDIDDKLSKQKLHDSLSTSDLAESVPDNLKFVDNLNNLIDKPLTKDIIAKSTNLSPDVQIVADVNLNFATSDKSAALGSTKPSGGIQNRETLSTSVLSNPIDAPSKNMFGHSSTDLPSNVPDIPTKDRPITSKSNPSEPEPKSRRVGPRIRGRGRGQRIPGRGQQGQLCPDALCGLVFAKEPLVANILFMLIVDMSRCNPKLSYLCAQYCAVNQNAERTEIKECQRQNKKQEEVLKKFRMHECNLLLATAGLEEGIDLPRCNLVLRWDIPQSYRSYGLCRSRARAPRASSALLCSDAPPATDDLLHNVATYKEIDQIISRKCCCGIQDEPPQTEEDHADPFAGVIKPYTPHESLLNPLSTCRVNDEKSERIDENHLVRDKNVSFVNRDSINDAAVDISVNYPIKVTLDDKCEVINDIKLNEINLDDAIANKVVSNRDASCINEPNDELLDEISLSVNKLVSVKDKCCTDVSEAKNVDARRNEINNGEYAVHEDKSDAIDTDNDGVCKKIKVVDEENVHRERNEFDKVENGGCKELSAIKKTNSNVILEMNVGNTVNRRSINDKLAKNTQNSIILNKIKTVNINQLEEIDNKDNLDTKENVPVIAKADSHKVLVDNGCSAVSNCDSKVDSVEKTDSKVRDGVASVDLNSAIALINRYCGKLPSDTFTRLAPQWWMEEVRLPEKETGEMRTAYICTLRLPLNCPVKYNIVGHPMPTRVLARRMVALQACRILHKSGELDNHLMPIGKENFKAADLEAAGASLNAESADVSDIARPGTTKRRQYYYKRTAWTFTGCQPIVDTSDSEIDAYNGVHRNVEQAKPKIETKKGTKRNMLYALVSSLRCALPERYNTRGRRLHAPQNANQAIGILMAREEPDNLQIPAFPVYTRSGEVRVSVEYVPDADVRLSPRRVRLIRRFMRFVFAEVLRVRRKGMRLQTEGSTHNNYYIVPTVKLINEDGTSKVDIDWAFLELIYEHTEETKNSDVDRPIVTNRDDDEDDDAMQDPVREKETVEKGKNMQNPLLKEGEVFVFDEQKYKEAVVTPWYRNKYQPQFFLVAEICWNLTPDSAFPSSVHSSFRDYYRSKYNAALTQSNQPLLDVDHTSARLNLLTPRYVNRKGVALPVSSERTRRAKRDRLDQKQILVPELCRVHPFAAPLWFATVALPCVLYRINALLIADEIRRAVAIDVGLGIPKIDEKTMPGFQWPPLDFGWSLAEVLNADTEKTEQKNDEEDNWNKEQIEKDPRDVEENERCLLEKGGRTINEILQQEKEEAESNFEIGTWSNEMASAIPPLAEFDDYLAPLPPNLTFCTSASGGRNWCEPIEKPKIQFHPSRTFSMADSDCSLMSSDFDTDDSDLDSDVSDDDTDTSGFCSSKNSNAAMGVRIEYKTAYEAEAVDLERKKVNPAPTAHEEDEEADRREYHAFIRSGAAPAQHVEKFHQSVARHKQEIIDNGHLIKHDQTIKEILPEAAKDQSKTPPAIDKQKIDELFPYSTRCLNFERGQVTLESVERNKRALLYGLRKSLSEEEIKRLSCFSMVDVDVDSPGYVNEKVVNVGFDKKEEYFDLGNRGDSKPYFMESKGRFDFDHQPTLEGHPGPSPSVILQALTMSNANDGINLERLETIGDSFLKFAITAYLYCAHPTVHEGKLSHMRSKQVSNLNLYRLGRSKRLGSMMIASKFEPHDNWLPPCHKPPPTLHPNTNQSQERTQQTNETLQDGAGCVIPYNLITQHSIPDKSIADCIEALIGAYLLECGPRGALLFMSWLGIRVLPLHHVPLSDDHPYVKAYEARKDAKSSSTPSPKRYRRQASSESSSGDEEEYGEEGEDMEEGEVGEDEGEAGEMREDEGEIGQGVGHQWVWRGRPVGSRRPVKEGGKWMLPIYGELKAPPSPLLKYIENPEGELEQMLSGYDALEKTLQYRFKDRSLLLQALTHASHQKNRLTDCYQRLEFLGDAILDYLITRHLYEDPRRHSPGALTDLRSALVNNTIFATLAARHGFHKFFRHMSPGLNEVLTKYVKIQEENGHSISEEHYLIQEDEMEQAEDVEVPKALGDLFESVAGAIFLDSGMCLGAVWRSYVNLMGAELEAFSAAAPKSPVRELLEAEPDTAKFGKPERLADGRRVRVCVEVFGRGAFKGVGRNYRIAKGTAARCALRHLKIHKTR